MRIVKSIFIFALILLASGCTYKGALREDFYKVSENQDKLHLNAYMFIGNDVLNGKYTADNVFRIHSVEIESSPGLRSAFKNSFESTFHNVILSNKIDDNEINKYDLLLLPKIELRGDAIYIQVKVIDATTDELIDVYDASGNVKHNIPASAHVLSVLNVIPFALLLSPVFEPIINNIVGNQAVEDLEFRIRETLVSVTNDIKNDRRLIAKASKKNQYSVK